MYRVTFSHCGPCNNSYYKSIHSLTIKIKLLRQKYIMALAVVFSLLIRYMIFIQKENIPATYILQKTLYLIYIRILNINLHWDWYTVQRLSAVHVLENYDDNFIGKDIKNVQRIAQGIKILLPNCKEKRQLNISCGVSTPIIFKANLFCN